jgi:hypothetical protein
MFAKGRQPAEETAKSECLRRWPELKLKCEAVYWQGHREGFVISKFRDGKSVFVAGARSASDAWRDCLIALDS